MTGEGFPSGWWLYVLECEGGVLYTGIAKDVEARYALHAGGRGAAFTRSNPPRRVVACVALATRSEALRAEHAFKQLPRAEKLRWCESGLAGFVALRAVTTPAPEKAP
jgi:putative endonuclease